MLEYYYKAKFYSGTAYKIMYLSALKYKTLLLKKVYQNGLRYSLVLSKFKTD